MSARNRIAIRRHFWKRVGACLVVFVLGNAFGALIGGEFEGTWLCFCFFTIAGRPKIYSPYGHFGRGGDDLGELGAARPAERPKFRPDFGLGDPAMCVKLVPKVCMYIHPLHPD
jgi:hypothetical protein